MKWQELPYNLSTWEDPNDKANNQIRYLSLVVVFMVMMVVMAVVVMAVMVVVAVMVVMW